MLRVRHSFAAPVGAYCLALVALGLWAGLASADRSSADRSADRNGREELPEVFDKPLPEGVQDLKDIQKHVRKIVDKVMPCTVGLQIGNAQGSGVIIDKEGHILTAGHVSGEAGRNVTIIMPSGRKLKGTTLGANVGIDSGLVKITQRDVEFPYIEMGQSADLHKGQWVVAIGHPGGYQPGRQPVVRVGRILDATAKLIRTDCALVGGDSGGPLFDMHGQVVGIHSRIGGSITFNIHVPIDTYTESWDKLAASEVWGNPLGFLGKAKPAGEPFLGVRPDPDAKAFKIAAVTPDSPAEKAGLRADDVIVRIDDRAIGSINDFDAVLRGKQPGNRVVLQVRRGDEELSITIILGKRQPE
jgi:serine protease Do